MRLLRLLALIALAAMPFPAQAEEVTGRVDAIYVEVAHGVLMEERRAQGSGIRWADVHVGGRKILARVPPDMPLSRGDRIAVRVGAPKSSQLAYILPMTTVSRAIGPDPNASIGR